MFHVCHSGQGRSLLHVPELKLKLKASMGLLTPLRSSRHLPDSSA